MLKYLAALASPVILAAGIGFVDSTIAAADSPIEPIDSGVIEIFMALPEADEICAQVGEISALVDTLVAYAGPDASFIFDAAVAYFQHSAEEGFGPNAAMTPEAEDVFRAWAYDCGGRTEPVSG
jgi:hypothetical protein